MAPTDSTAGQSTAALSAAGRRFIGSVTNKMDPKGRVSVPVDMRRVLNGPEPGETMPDQMQAAVSFFGQELWCGGQDLPDVMMHMVRKSDYFSDVVSEFEIQCAVFAEIVPIRFDENGRVTIPPQMREDVGLDASVTFEGRGAYFVIGDADMLTARRVRRRAMMAEQQDILMAKGMPGDISKRGGPVG